VDTIKLGRRKTSKTVMLLGSCLPRRERTTKEESQYQGYDGICKSCGAHSWTPLCTSCIAEMSRLISFEDSSDRVQVALFFFDRFAGSFPEFFLEKICEPVLTGSQLRCISGELLLKIEYKPAF